MIAWTALVPVKGWERAKTRLDLPAAQRRALARAFALDLLDLLEATSEIAETIVITDEDELLCQARPAGVSFLADPAVQEVDTLNAAIGAGRYWAQDHHPTDRLLVIPTDLPCLTPHDLSHALEVLGQHRRAFVPDRSETGTSLLTAATPAQLVWQYGDGSAQRHRQLGLTPVTTVSDTVRLDVDTIGALQSARRRGVHGTRTGTALAHLGSDLPPIHSDSHASKSKWGSPLSSRGSSRAADEM